MHSNASNIAELNPFRYRSYYYDTETNLYFLKTGYYDPPIGRFMTIDDILYFDPKINATVLFVGAVAFSFRRFGFICSLRLLFLPARRSRRGCARSQGACFRREYRGGEVR